jgi:hypothetical protein
LILAAYSEIAYRLKICRWQHRAGSIPASGTSIHAAYSPVAGNPYSATFRSRSAILSGLLERRVARREINASVIPTLLADVARDAARHNGIPEAWRNYLPERYSNDT